MKRTAISVAWVFGASFYAAAAIGFIPNPLLGPDGLFVTNTDHNVVHLLPGVGFTVVAIAGLKASVVFMQAFGVIYPLTGAVGCLATGHGGDAHLLGLIHLSTSDNFLHLGLGAVIATAGWYFHARSACVRPSIHQGQKQTSMVEVNLQAERSPEQTH
jgi:hypothetical protein